MSTQHKHVIIVAGAGPAGMAVAASLGKAGHEIIILNRDIKFGGLAEYGIFPSKLKFAGACGNSTGTSCSSRMSIISAMCPSAKTKI